MPALFEYLLKANISLLLFCAGYYLVLRRLTFYTLNRIYLICAIAFSATYPLIDLSSFMQQHKQLAQPVQAMQVIVVNWQAPNVPAVTDHAVDWWMMGRIIFFTGIFCMLIRFCLQMVSLYRLTRKSKEEQLYSYRIRAIAETVNPFSFWQSIYINPGHHEPEQLKAILAHEQVHITGWHTLDILFAELSTIVYWFNPGVWLIKKAVAENIEFITDRAILRQGTDSKLYQYSLLHVALTAGSPAMVNHFNFSKLKKRILMMNRKASAKVNLTRYVFILPLMCLLLFCFTFSKANVAVKARNAVKQMAHLVTETKTSVPLSDSANSHQPLSLKEKPGVITGVDTIPQKKKQPVLTKLTLKANEPYTVFINGKAAEPKELTLMNSNDIESINVVKGNDVKQLNIADTTKRTVFMVTTKNSVSGKAFVNSVEGKGVTANPMLFSKGVPLTSLFVTNTAPRQTITLNSINKVADTIIINPAGTAVKMGNGIGTTSDLVVIGSGAKNDKGSTIINGHDFSTFTNGQNLLLVVDEHEVSVSTLQSLRPNHIGSFTVLNADQAKKKYGSKGRNGALVVTTKTPSYAFINDRQNNNSTFTITRPGPPDVKKIFGGSNSQTFNYQFSTKASGAEVNSFSTGVKHDTTGYRTVTGNVIIQGKGVEPGKAYIVIDGRSASYKDYVKLPPDSIKSVTILKNAGATVLYGEKAKNGVIVITTKP